MIIGLACHDHNDATQGTMEHLRDSASEELHVVIYDNNSVVPYKESDYKKYPFKVTVIRNEKNVGHYYCLKLLYDRYKEDDELIGLMHNDLWIYEKNWDVRMTDCFKKDPLLGAVGLCGSNEVDDRGGRGGGTKCFFRGEIGGEGQAAGLRITHLAPTAIFDSLFMMFRTSMIPFLMTEKDPWKDITLGHFYDRIWPLRLVEKGLHVGTLGVECDHWGGVTVMANARYRDDAIQWLADRGLPTDNPETDMYLIAENRYLTEYRDVKHFIPCVIDDNYRYRRT